MMLYKKKACLIIGFFCFAIYFAIGQDQKLVDSLVLELNSGFHKGDELVILAKIAAEETNPESQLEFSDLLIQKASIDSSYNFLHQGYLQKGNALKFKGNNPEALKAYFKSLDYAKLVNDEKGIGSVMISVAGTYTAMGNSNNAQNYFNKGILVLRKLNDSIKNFETYNS